MTIANSFKSFCKDLVFDTEAVSTSCKEITKKLNSYYYDEQGNDTDHFYYVGSVGRRTAIKNVSDIDVIFDLPTSTYIRFNAYESNGQSALLQEVKEVLKERYPKTDIKGDGQVVVIEFTTYTVELVPAFKQSDNRFKYPDTHEGGSWKTTNPLAEQKEVQNADIRSSWNYRNFCRILRKWKNENGIVIGGLLIDSLCYNHFKEENYYVNSSYEDYYQILTNAFYFLKSLDKNQSYWYAPGSNQKVYSNDNGFISKSESAYKALVNASDDEKETILADLLGSDFNQDTKRTASFATTEQFIHQLFPVDIRYSLAIDCVVSQNGFRDFLLRKALSENHILRHNKTLTFKIVHVNVPEPYSIYWKVRNVGPEAIRRNMIRGEIKLTNSSIQKEHTNFQGPHYVECFIVKNGVCVARDRIDVPIGSI